MIVAGLKVRKCECNERNMKIVILDGYTATGRSCEQTQGASDKQPLIDGAWKELEEMGTLMVYDRTLPSETVARAADAQIVLTNKVVLGRAEIAQLPKLRYIGVLATGYNVVDIAAAHERGITVTNVPAYSTESVAQMVFAHLLNVTNRTEHYARQNRCLLSTEDSSAEAGSMSRWTTCPDFCYWDFPHTELAGKTFGIVGLGHIGLRVAQIALAFGMRVKALTSKDARTLPEGIEKVGLEELLETADVLSLHCPLTDTTRHLVNEDALRRMKPTAILINTGRGPLVDEQAVANALKEKRLAAFCADVLTVEPPGKDHPLLGQPNAFITPHIAWATTEARRRLTEVAIGNVRAFLNGKPVNVV